MTSRSEKEGSKDFVGLSCKFMAIGVSKICQNCMMLFIDDSLSSYKQRKISTNQTGGTWK